MRRRLLLTLCVLSLLGGIAFAQGPFSADIVRALAYYGITAPGVFSASAVSVKGDINITGTYKVNGTPIGSGIGGSGTSGYLPLFSGASTLTNSVLRQSSGRIGIGIAPTALLHLAAGSDSLAPFKFTDGTLLAAPQPGALEYSSDVLYLTTSTGRKTLAFLQSPSFVTPSLGAASATSVNRVTITQPASGSTLTIQDGYTLTANGNATVSGSNTGDQTITLSGDISGTGTDAITTTLPTVNSNVGTFTKLTVTAKGLVTAATSAVLASADFATQGTTNTLLHGNTGSNPSWSGVVESDLSLSNTTTADVTTTKHGFVPRGGNLGYFLRDDGTWQSISVGFSHALLSATHSDATAAAVVRGDLITGQGAPPTWARMALGTTGAILRSNGSDLAYTLTTWPNATTQYQLLYSSANNTVSEVTKANSAILATNGVGLPSLVGPLANGQLLVGSTGGIPVVAGLTGTSNQIVVTTGAGSITLSTPQDLGTVSTPQFTRLGLGAAADASALVATTGQIGLQLNPYAVGAGSTGEVRFRELAANGVNYVGFKASDSLAGNVIWTLPVGDSSGTQCISSNGSGIMSWSACSGGTGTPGGSNTQLQFNNSATFGGSPNLTWVSPALTVGVAGATSGQVKLTGATSGTITLQANAIAGTATLTLPGTTGTLVTTGDTGTVTSTMLSVVSQLKGGTGISTAGVTDGQLLIGQSSDNSWALATLTAGTGISITNGGHSITIAATGTQMLPSTTFFVGGIKEYGVTQSSYPSGATYNTLAPNSGVFSIDSNNLPAGTYRLEAILASEKGSATASLELVNLTDAPDTGIATISSTSATGEKVLSSAITFAAGGSSKDYAVKLRSSSSSYNAWAWSIRIVKTS